MSRKQIAIDEANKIDNEIIETLKKGSNFRVDAGAGSGKTYSLIKVVEWLQNNLWYQFKMNNQKVACITYTNVAVDVIQSRLKSDSFIVPSTIHSFVWQTMKQFQNDLIININEILSDKTDVIDFSKIKKIEYTLGKRYQEEEVLYLFHDDVIKLFVVLMDNQKFRTFLRDKYPIILIDEYQDSFKVIIDKFIQYFVDKGVQPQFGFFGDSWQTIYQMQGAVGEIENNNIVIIKKKSNFRSAKNIVEMLNKIRPDLPQISAEDDNEGSVAVVDCSDYSGIRLRGGQFNDELPQNIFEERLKKMEELVLNDSSKTNKTLILTHRVIAKNNGYADLLNLLDDGFKDKTDPFLVFFMEKAELIFNGLEQSKTNLIFDALGIKQYPINTIADKKKWNDFHVQFKSARHKTVKDVLDVLKKSKLMTFPDSIEKIYSDYPKNQDDEYGRGTIKSLMEMQYSQIMSAVSFHKPESLSSTNHGVKGEEYDNVLFVASKGWNNYNFDKYIPMTESEKNENDSSYKRNRNLFYVCCSRAKTKFVLFITYPVSPKFRVYLEAMVGKGNYYSYSDFLTKVSGLN